MEYEKIVVSPNAGVGAFVSNVDLANFDDVSLIEMKKAFAQYGVLFFRDQQLDESQHIALAKRWGDININRFFTSVPG